MQLLLLDGALHLREVPKAALAVQLREQGAVVWQGAVSQKVDDVPKEPPISLEVVHPAGVRLDGAVGGVGQLSKKRLGVALERVWR